MREGRAQHQSPDQKSQRLAQPALVIIGGYFHAHGVNARQTEAREKPAQQQGRKSAGPQQTQITSRPCQRTYQKHLRRRKPVWHGKHRKHQRAQNKPQLHRRREVAEWTGLQVKKRNKLRQHRIARKPQRGAGKLGEDDDKVNVGFDKLLNLE